MTNTNNGTPKPLVALLDQGQSIWLDFITRQFIHSGDLQKMIEDEGLRGMTSNPTIFEKAISAGEDYNEQLRSLVQEYSEGGPIFEALAVQDIREACDLFRPVYDSSDGLDGYVSIEVSPLLAHNTEGTVEEGRRLWKSVDRPNVMIKVPGTAEGAPAVEALLSDGINVNVTLLFSIENHERVMWKYINALETRVAAGQPIDKIASVASFFVSRVDTLVEKMLDEKIAKTDDASEKEQLAALKGKAAIANAKLAYARFREIFDSERFAKLQAQGAKVQRPLWASTSSKNPAYRDVIYVEELIGPDTVNTLPMATIKAFQDHGVAARTIDTDVDAAREVMAKLEEAGISYEAVTRQLEQEGVASFEKSYDDLLKGVDEKRKQMQSVTA